MAEFDPSTIQEPSNQRFLRLRSGIYVGQPMNLGRNVTDTPNHEAIAKEHRIHRDIEEAIKNAPDTVDGGYFLWSSGGLYINQGSNGFALPVSGSRARELTAQVMKQLLPDRPIFTDMRKWFAFDQP